MLSVTASKTVASKAAMTSQSASPLSPGETPGEVHSSSPFFTPRLILPPTPEHSAVYIVRDGFPVPDNWPIYTSSTLAQVLEVDRDTIGYHAALWRSHRARVARAYVWPSFIDAARFCYHLAYHSRKLSHLRQFFGTSSATLR